MADGTHAGPALLGTETGAIVFTLAGGRYALPLDVVEAVMPPSELSRIPHAPAALLGAGNFGGQVLPVVDPRGMLRAGVAHRGYDGAGEVIRISAAGGRVGVWVDRVERLVPSLAASDGMVAVIDPEPLVRLGLTAPALASTVIGQLGDAGELVARATRRGEERTYFLVEAAGERVRLPREAVREFLGQPSWVAVPGAPAGFIGVAVVHGAALPIVSLAALLDLPASGTPGNFALIDLPGTGGVLLGFDRVIGLRISRRQTGRRWVDQTLDRIAGDEESGRELDVAGALSEGLRAIIAGFAPAAAAAEAPDAVEGGDPYLLFFAGGEAYALAVEAVERVVPAPPRIALPRLADTGAVAGAIELRGQLLPVVRIDGAAVPGEPDAYVILRGGSGLMAIAADRVERLLTLRPDQIAPPPGERGWLDGVAVIDGAEDVLRILAADRIGGIG